MALHKSSSQLLCSAAVSAAVVGGAPPPPPPRAGPRQDATRGRASPPALPRRDASGQPARCRRYAIARNNRRQILPDLTPSPAHTIAPNPIPAAALDRTTFVTELRDH